MWLSHPLLGSRKLTVQNDNQSPLSILKRGVPIWNSWRQQHNDLIACLDNLDVRGADLRGALLFNTNIRWANLTGANLSTAILYQAEFFQSCLRDCDLRDSDMRGAKLHDADMRGALFEGANLYRCDFINTRLDGASFGGAYCGTTAFANVDLSEVLGLDSVRHMGPSNIDLLSIAQCTGKLPLRFLHGAGVPDSLIARIGVASASDAKPTYASCFISYSHRDEAFASALYESLLHEGVVVWYAPEDVRPGLKLYEQIREAIHSHDRLLLVLSHASMRSEWVMTELRNARRRESNEGRQILFPVGLAPIEEIKEWECFDADTGKDLALEVREYFIPDFSHWMNGAVFRQQLSGVLRGLRLNSL